MKKYDIEGMSCAACSSRVEKAAGRVDGVTSCAVNLLTNSMLLDGSYDEEAVIKAVTKAGYGISPSDGASFGAKAFGEASSKALSSPVERKGTAIFDSEISSLERRLISSAVFLVFLMYLSMGGMIGLPRPYFFDNPIILALSEAILAAIVMIIGQKFFIKGFLGLIRLSPNMDTLVSIGSGAAFVYSTAVLFVMAANPNGAAELVHELYYESAAMIITLITVGKLLEARAKGKTTSALRSLMEMMPDTVVLIRDGKEVTVPFSEAGVGDELVLRPGDSIPLDGVVISGISSVNEAAVTGESIPVDKEKGDRVCSGTVNLSGVLICKITHIGGDTTLSKIIKAVSDASATKAPIARIADRVSGIFVPAVMLIAVITAAVWLFLGKNVGFALARGISVLVISCPCALGLATPVAITVGSGVGAKNGILFKTAASLEATGRIDTVVLDKTGTVTSGNPRVTDIVPLNGCSKGELLSLAASLEAGSEHPLGKAIVNEAKELGAELFEVNGFKAITGSGVSALLADEPLVGGSISFMSDKLSEDDIALTNKISEKGKTPLVFSYGGRLIGIIGVGDTLKEDSKEAIAELYDMKIKTVLLTGDNKAVATSIAEQVGIDEVYASVMPEGKAEVIAELTSKGKVAMVGDGINDAPALTRADVGMAIGAGTDIAIEAADVVLTGSGLGTVSSAVRLGRETLKIIRQNLFLAFFYNVLGIPLAAGVFIPILGWEMSPMLGALAMSLSSFCVVSNALRLNFVKLGGSNNKTKENIVSYEKEKEKMEKVIKVSGMMCPHCEAHVKKALEAIPEVASAVASHESGTVAIKLLRDVDEAVLRSAIEAAGYTVL